MRLPQPAILALIYAIWVLVGASLLMLPLSTVSQIRWSDALFTATSAVTVTGLSVVDTGSAFTTFGQGVILLLVQLGGMGLMTFAVIIMSSIGLRVGLSERQYLREEMGLQTLGGTLSVAWMIFRIVVACELLGAAILCFEFVPEFGWKHGSWQALFHSISAFNNAGFSLFSNSMMNYVDSPVVMLTLSAQFIIGGLGFLVVTDLLIQRKWRKVSLHTHLMLIGTLGLCIASLLVYGLLEWNNPNTLGGLDNNHSRVLALWFEAMTPRTAGFNSLDTSELYESTTLFTMILMIIGGGSTSTAGGIKVTTFVLLILATVAFFRSSGSIRAFGHSVGQQQALKVMALLTVSVFLMSVSLFLLLATQDGRFLDFAFEVCSAFGTVGLSLGVTGELDNTGRSIICAVMFLGRVGPLTLGVFLANKIPPKVKYPEGEVYLG